eukprot:9033693-Pyramimonas_sp.AAC.1
MRKRRLVGLNGAPARPGKVVLLCLGNAGADGPRDASDALGCPLRCPHARGHFVRRLVARGMLGCCMGDGEEGAGGVHGALVEQLLQRALRVE